MITEPPTDGQRTPLQDFETLYIGRVRSLPSFVGPLSAMNWLNQDLVNQDLAKSGLGQIKTMRDLRRKFNDQDGSYRLGSESLGTGLMGTSTRLNDE